MIVHLGLVTETPLVKPGELAIVSAAIQKQVTRDLAPIWNVQATMDSFDRLEDIPAGYWPVVVVEETQGSGSHRDRNGQPLALVEAGPTWSLAASHEALEMLVDPFASRVIPGASPDPNQGRVEFLVEICDPCQDAQHAYTCNEVLVSDFCTPHYFDPVTVTGVRYSFSGAIPAPRQVLPGGCLSWRLPATGDWFQLNHFHDQPEIKNLGPLPAGGTLRGEVDAAVRRPRSLSKSDHRTGAAAAAVARHRDGRAARASFAEEVRALIAAQKGTR